MSKEAMKMALEALETERENYQDWDKQDGAPEYIYEAITALREALAEQPAQQEPVAWKLVPREPTHEMLKAMDECSTEGYDERLYAGHASSVYMAAVDAAPTPPAQRTWVGLTDDDKCVKELYESDTDPEWIDGYTAGLKDAENKLRRYNAQPALVVEQLNPVAEVKLKQQGGNAGFATVINEMYEIIEMLCLDAEAAHGIKENT